MADAAAGVRIRWHGLAVIAATCMAVQTASAIPQTQGAPAPTPRTGACRDCATDDSARKTRAHLLLKLDSLRWEIEHRQLTDLERQAATRELARTIRALEASHESSAAGAHALRAVEVDAADARERRNARRVAVTVESRHRMRGYIGVTFDGPWAERPGANEDKVIRFYQYPKVALVDASSPAERAGILIGDTLVALNGDDVRDNEISFGTLLVPNRRITMRVRRDGLPKDIVVTVGRAPEYHVRRVTPLAPNAPAAVAARAAEAPERVRVFGRAPSTGVREAPGFIYWFGNDALAGARLETITAGLAKALGVGEGVLVIRTVPGTAMFDSGLQDGDVVTHVNRTKVRTVGELQRALTDGEERERRLVIVRDKRQREIILRW